MFVSKCYTLTAIVIYSQHIQTVLYIHHTFMAIVHLQQLLQIHSYQLLYIYSNCYKYIHSNCCTFIATVTNTFIATVVHSQQLVLLDHSIFCCSWHLNSYYCCWYIVCRSTYSSLCILWTCSLRPNSNKEDWACLHWAFNGHSLIPGYITMSSLILSHTFQDLVEVIITTYFKRFQLYVSAFQSRNQSVSKGESGINGLGLVTCCVQDL